MAFEKIVLITLVVSAIALTTNGQRSCTSPDNLYGTCIDIRQCPPLWQTLLNVKRTNSELQFLRKSQCPGYSGQFPEVCCPNGQEGTESTKCLGPDRSVGSCVELYLCESVSKLLYGSNQVSAATESYVRSLRCSDASSQTIKVCCPSTNIVVPTAPAPRPVQPPRPNPNEQTGGGGANNLLPASDQCGRVASMDRIYGGEETAIDAYPWMGIVIYLNKRNQFKLLCGSCLISKRYVLTAGHCVAGEVLKIGPPTKVRFGEHDTRTEIDCRKANGGGEDCNDGPLEIPISEYFAHPEYNPDDNYERKNDIAMLRLQDEAPYTDFIRPICLPNNDVTNGAGANGLEFFVAGWGSTENSSSSPVKLEIKIDYVPVQTCQQSYVGRLASKLWSKQLCAGGKTGIDSCRGDSGGPLMLFNTDVKLDPQDNGRWEVIGVVSFGPTPCGRKGVPGVYTKVADYLQWIRSSIKP